MKKVEKTKLKLLAAALNVFMEKGVASATVPEIVKRAAMAHGTFYRYFKNKKACFNHIIEEFIETLINDFQQTLVEGDRNALITGPLRVIELIRENKDIMRLFLMENLFVDPDLRSNLFRQKGLMDKHLKKQLMTRGDDKQTATVKTLLVGNALESVILGEVILGISDPPRPNVSLEQQLEYIIYGLNRT